jgi:hypothetical protein
MRWILFFACVAAFAAEPLPVEAERRAGLARLLPVPFSGSALLQVARMKGLSAEQRAELAGEAYRIAMSVKLKDFGSYAGGGGNSLSASNSMDSLEDSHPLVIAVEAYQMNRRLPFPLFAQAPLAGCEQSMVEDPLGYFDAALVAGEEEFRRAFREATHPVAVARAGAALRKASRSLIAELVPELDAKLASLGNSDREFHYAAATASLGTTAIALGLRTSYRAAFLKNWQQKRCEDLPEDRWKDAIAQLKEEFPPREVGLGPKDEDLFEEEELAWLFEDVEQLRGKGASISDFLLKLEQWQPKKLTAAIGREAVGRDLIKGFTYFVAVDALQKTNYETSPVMLWGEMLASGTLKKDAPVAWMVASFILKDWAHEDPIRIAALKSIGDGALTAYLEFDFKTELMRKNPLALTQ